MTDLLPHHQTTVDKVCGTKDRLGRRAARGRAEHQRRRTGEPVAAYRCPFCHHWHVGHVPSLESMRNIAAAIRNLPERRPV